MKRYRSAVPLVALAVLNAVPSAAQTFKTGARIAGQPHVPTEAECIDALNEGQLLATLPDGRFVVVNGNVVYWIGITPAFLDCGAAKFLPKTE